MAATSTAAEAADSRIHTRTRGAGGVAVDKLRKFCGTCFVLLSVLFILFEVVCGILPTSS